MTGFLKSVGFKILEKGYPIVPVKPGAKSPTIREWQKFEATPEKISKLLANGHADAGVGILTGKISFVDIDVYDPEFAIEIEDLTVNHIGLAPLRIGNAPKRGLMYRTEEPFRKIASKAWIDDQGRENRVEILGLGQQFVSNHFHPDTGKPYIWPHGGPDRHKAADLGIITEARARWLVEEFNGRCKARGWREHSQAPDTTVPVVDDELGVNTKRLGLREDELRGYVMAIPNNDWKHDEPKGSDRPGWFNVVAAIHHESSGEACGKEIAREWSVQSPKHYERGGDRFEITWNGLGGPRPDPITARYVVHFAKVFQPLSPDFAPADLSVASWLEREIPPLDLLLGNVLSTTTRALFIAPTGLGKTNIALAMSFSIANGDGFLHWRGNGNARRVLYIDGEMSARVFQRRIKDALRRAGKTPGKLFAFSREDFPDMPPLNTESGQKYIDSVLEKLGGIDLIVFDNIQALIPGDLKDSESWQQVLPWARELTRRHVGQLWIHHTGLDESHGYGDSSREWQLDVVALMEKVKDDNADIAFRLSFTKARERAPENRDDFKPAIITLANDKWSSETAGARVKLSSQQQAALELLTEPMSEADWRELAVSDRKVTTAKDRKGQLVVFSRIYAKLAELNLVSTMNGIVSRVQNARASGYISDEDHGFD